MDKKTAPVVINVPTLIAISAIAISMTVGLHEGIHAFACVAVGGSLQEFSALHVLCDCPNVWQSKIVAGSASIANLLLGFLFLYFLRHSEQKSGNMRYFLWLAMLLNWLYGAGYWAFSGVANIGDWATVIAGWSPYWLWRILMIIIGFAAFMGFVWKALHEFGRLVYNDVEALPKYSMKLAYISYFTGIVVIGIAGLFYPGGIVSLPVLAGLFAVIGATSPLLWMMFWFQAPQFKKAGSDVLSIQFSWPWVVSGAVVAGLYLLVLAPSIQF